MKKKFLKLIIIILLIFLAIFLIFKLYCNYHYKEMKQKVTDGILWQFHATRPNGCLKETDGIESEWTAPWLISQGYIKKDDLLDVDSSSYCRAYALTKCKNLEFQYKIYLKCKFYTTKGYKDYWD